ATAMCLSCRRPICKECSRLEGFRYYCKDCPPISAPYPYPLPPSPVSPQAGEPFDEKARRWWRADWSIAEVVIALAVVFGIYNAIGVVIVLSAEDAASRLFYGYLLYGAVLCPLIALSTFIILRRHHRGWKELGIRWGRIGRTLLYGILGGVVALLSSFAIYLIVYNVFRILTGRDPGTSESQNMQTLTGFALFLALLGVVVLAPVFEEVFFRGLFYSALRRRLGVALGVLVSAIVFGVLHFEPLSMLSLIMVGAILAFLYERTDSLFAPMLAHALYNGVVILIAILSR
ncbi:MAG: hypothetical protein A2W01_09015, partial [Candidatus Solincola sediminis]